MSTPTAIAAAIIALVVVIIGLQLPELRRYMKIRSM